MERDFGIFSPLFESAHYLPLLNLTVDAAPKAVELVKDCCHKIANPYPDICRLLAEPSWRAHLVAAVAVIVSGHDSEAVKRLWHRLDTGSWVTPQIGVALYLVDPAFEAQSRIRLEAGCPIDESEYLSFLGLDRHSAAGPAGTISRSAKAAATLLHLVQLISPAPSWVEILRVSDNLQGLLARDIDESATITDGWLYRIREIAHAG
jgi:hypothetical protein